MKRLRRLLCRLFGHRWAAERRSEPVTAFTFCARCGKLGWRL